MWKKSNNPKVEELTKSVKDRTYNLSCLSAIKSEELNSKGKPRRFCAWCCEGELHHGNAKYCTTICSDSAMAWAYPQQENALKILLFRQDLKCIGCGYDYKPFLEAMIAKDRARYGGGLNGDGTWDLERLPWNYFKRLKSHVPKEKKPEIDHVLSIAMGGHSLGIENTRAICYECHKTKTKQDAKDRAAKNKLLKS